MNTTKHTTFKFRLRVDLMEWLKDYAKRTAKPMAQIIKEPLQELQRKDTQAQRRLQQEAKNE